MDPKKKKHDGFVHGIVSMTMVVEFLCYVHGTLEDHPMGGKWLVIMVIVVGPLPYMAMKMAYKWG